MLCGLLLISFIIIVISISIDDNDWLFWSATVIAGIGGGLLITVLFNIMFTKQKFTNYNEDMAKEVNDYLEQKNNHDMRGISVKWKLSKCQFYISVEKTHFDHEYDR